MKEHKPLLIASGAALLCASLYVFGYGGLLSAELLPGIGLGLIAWLLLAGGCLVCKPRWNAESVFLTACAALLGGAYALFGSVAMKILNAPVLVFATAQALMSLAGQNERPALSLAGLWTGFGRFIGALFIHWPAPFRALRRMRGTDGRLRGLGWGLLAAVLVLAVVLPLLTSADAVFGQGLQGLLDCVDWEHPLSFIARAAHTALLALMLFSFLYALSQAPQQIRTCGIREQPGLPFAVLICALCAVYAAFVYVQFRYLFGGAETALMEGGYAQYARSGFFQLVAVALINLAVLGAAVTFARPRGTLRILCLLLTLLTAVILASSFRRMRLYILVYGLSTLRLLTLWAMAMIACALGLTAARLFCARRIFPALTAVLLAGWVALNYLNVDAAIARYNVNAYAQGRLETLDMDYLRGLSPDVIPAVGRDEYPQREEEQLPWFCWDASRRHLR